MTNIEASLAEARASSLEAILEPLKGASVSSFAVLVAAADLLACAGCGGSSRHGQLPTVHYGPLPAIHARQGRYSLQQIDHAFAAVGLHPLGVTRFRGVAAVTFDQPNHLARPKILVYVKMLTPLVAPGMQRPNGSRLARRRNLEIAYQTGDSSKVQAVLSELR